ncbi:MAG: FKBP-type peptidyl-prolyl cis-trans isomerase [Spirochaetaceae bacterium]|jgi:FKBP-type peptidyl-prolyl cis-trans isomerase|nr:FKBP-type peptidyl-prolyl cis-trans isomerase [Spirochaetaceae bacterium]
MLKKFVCCLVFAAIVLGTCFAEGGEADLSYAVGVLLGTDLKKSNFKLDYTVVAEAMRKTIETDDPGMSEESAALIVRNVLQIAQDKLARENRAKSAVFLEENAKKKNIQTTKSGLQYELIAQGDGAHVSLDTIVKVNYTGSLIDGSVFDSNAEDGGPAEIPLNRVIPGFAEGIALMQVGGRVKLFIPPDLGYGEEGAGENIPPNAVLIFDVELLGTAE